MGLSLVIKINVVTSILTIAATVAILYFQIVATGTSWLHFLFGFGLLSYAVGRVSIGAFTKENNLGLRAFNLAASLAMGVLSIIIIFFPLVLIPSGANTNVYVPYGYFARITLILIGVDCLVSGILGGFFSRQKTEASEIKSESLA